MKLGHCLNCDLTDIINAWIERGGIDAATVISRVTATLANGIIVSAKEGQELVLLEGVVNHLRGAVTTKMKALQMDAKATAPGGHA